MRKLIAAAVIVSAGSAFAVTAHWTGQQEYVTSVRGMPAVNCEYDYGGSKVWRQFKRTCPISIEIDDE